MDIVKLLLPIIVFSTILYLLIDYQRLRVIKYRPLGGKTWFIAFSREQMWHHLHGNMADVVMPAEPLIVRIYRKIRPVKFTHCNSSAKQKV